MRKTRVEKVEIEIKRLLEAINTMKHADAGYYNKYDHYDHGVYTGAVRRASMELTRALANMRKSNYETLLGEE